MPTEQDIYSVLTEIFHDLFGNDELVLGPQTKADEVEGWDSINHINLIVAVEGRFKVRFSAEEIENLSNVGDLTRLLLEKTASR